MTFQLKIAIIRIRINAVSIPNRDYMTFQPADVVIEPSPLASFNP